MNLVETPLYSLQPGGPVVWGFNAMKEEEQVEDIRYPSRAVKTLLILLDCLPT